tara:strand:- start:52 stop:183 length:132 start_codon:yes stop_codon:yes gene_type:complete
MGKMKRIWAWLQEQEKSFKKEVNTDIFTITKHNKQERKKDGTV